MSNEQQGQPPDFTVQGWALFHELIKREERAQELGVDDLVFTRRFKSWMVMVETVLTKLWETEQPLTPVEEAQLMERFQGLKGEREAYQRPVCAECRHPSHDGPLGQAAICGVALTMQEQLAREATRPVCQCTGGGVISQEESLRETVERADGAHLRNPVEVFAERLRGWMQSAAVTPWDDSGLNSIVEDMERCAKEHTGHEWQPWEKWHRGLPQTCPSCGSGEIFLLGTGRGCPDCKFDWNVNAADITIRSSAEAHAKQVQAAEEG